MTTAINNNDCHDRPNNDNNYRRPCDDDNYYYYIRCCYLCCTAAAAATTTTTATDCTLRTSNMHQFVAYQISGRDKRVHKLKTMKRDNVQ